MKYPKLPGYNLADSFREPEIVRTIRQMAGVYPEPEIVRITRQMADSFREPEIVRTIRQMAGVYPEPEIVRITRQMADSFREPEIVRTIRQMAGVYPEPEIVRITRQMADLFREPEGLRTGISKQMADLFREPEGLRIVSQFNWISNLTATLHTKAITETTAFTRFEFSPSLTRAELHETRDLIHELESEHAVPEHTVTLENVDGDDRIVVTAQADARRTSQGGITLLQATQLEEGTREHLDQVVSLLFEQSRKLEEQDRRLEEQDRKLDRIIALLAGLVPVAGSFEFADAQAASAFKQAADDAGVSDELTITGGQAQITGWAIDKIGQVLPAIVMLAGGLWGQHNGWAGGFDQGTATAALLVELLRPTKK